MPYARTWSQLESHLPAGWTEARVSLRVEDPARLQRAAAVLGPLGPGRSGETLVFRLLAGGGTNGAGAVRRLLALLDEEGLPYVLRLLEATESAAAQAADDGAGAAGAALAPAWDAALATLPADWSDVYGEIALESSDLLERAALLLGPINPHRNPDAVAFRFRAARLHGYGASAGMVRRCLERLDADRIDGSVTILRALCETRPVATQGPQWVEGGKNF